MHFLQVDKLPMQIHTPSNDMGGAFSDGRCLRNLHSDCLVDLFQAAHLTQEWMEKKLPIYLKRDTECLNHNTWMINCKLLLSFSPCNRKYPINSFTSTDI